MKTRLWIVALILLATNTAFAVAKVASHAPKSRPPVKAAAPKSSHKTKVAAQAKARAPLLKVTVQEDTQAVRQNPKVVDLIRDIEGNGMFNPRFRLRAISPSKGVQRCNDFIYCKDYDLIFTGGKNQIETFKATVIRRGKNVQIVVQR